MITTEEFERWWNQEGSAIAPTVFEDTSEHVKHVSEIAWANGHYMATVTNVKSQQWQPIETAPKDGTAFLAVSQEHIKRDWLPDMVEWADGGWVYTDNFNEFLFTLSHWMPMPSLPLPAPPMSDK